MYLVKTPDFIQNLFPGFTWRIPNPGKNIFLTFDDGPIPEVTPWVLDLLDEYDAKGTFFCVGDNIKKNPEIFREVKDRGHSVGNHTFNHLNGWATDNVTYLRNIRKADRSVKSELFRPPYGRIKPSQAKFLSRHYRIVMWDVLSGDFDPEISKEQCLQNVIKNTTEGSVIVFHDSLKAEEKLRYVLPKVLEHFKALGYSFPKLSEKKLKQEKNLSA